MLRIVLLSGIKLKSMISAVRHWCLFFSQSSESDWEQLPSDVGSSVWCRVSVWDNRCGFTSLEDWLWSMSRSSPQRQCSRRPRSLQLEHSGTFRSHLIFLSRHGWQLTCFLVRRIFFARSSVDSVASVFGSIIHGSGHSLGYRFGNSTTNASGVKI